MKANAWSYFRKQYTEEQRNLARLPLQLTINQTIPAQNATVTNAEQSVHASNLIRRSEEHARDVISDSLFKAICSITSRPIVIFLDTLERLRDAGDRTLGDWLFGHLLKTISDQLDGALLVVAAGQPPLSLGQYFPNIVMKSLDHFSFDETVRFLKRRGGIKESSLHRSVFETTQGHPLLTDIITKVWIKETAGGHLPLSFPQWKEEFEEVARTEWVMNRVIERLDKIPGEIVRYGVVLRSFNMDDLRNMFPQLLNDGASVYEKLLAYPFILRVGNGRYAFHELIRRVQTSFLRHHATNEWQILHRRALDYYSQELKKENKQEEQTFKVNSIFHQLILDESIGLADWELETNTALIRWDRQYWADLMSIVFDPTMVLSERAKAIVELQQGKFYVQDAKWSEATDSFNNALTSFSIITDPLGIASSKKGIGDVLYSRGRYDDALEAFSSAHSLFDSVSNEQGIARTLKSIGDIHLKRGSYDQSLAAYRSAHKIFAGLGNKMGEASCLFGAADVDYTQANYFSAVLNYEEALKLYEQVNANFESANALRGLGEVRVRQGDYEAAKKLFLKSSKIYESLNAMTGLALAYRGIGDILLKQGQLDGAKEQYEKSLTIFEKTGSGMERATGLLRIGDLHRWQHEYPLAIQVYEKAIKLYTDLGGKMGIANVNLRLGEIHSELGQTDLAIELLKTAYQHYSKLGGKLGIANALRSIGDAEQRRGNLEVALDNFQSSLQVYTELRVDAGIANCNYGMGETYQQLGNTPMAIQHYQSSLAIYKKLNNVDNVKKTTAKLNDLGISKI
jgi:tetratricopeptide (TPR) repeat protein